MGRGFLVGIGGALSSITSVRGFIVLGFFPLAQIFDKDFVKAMAACVHDWASPLGTRFLDRVEIRNIKCEYM